MRIGDVYPYKDRSHLLTSNGLTLGLQCKACGCSLSTNGYDTELCNVCMEVVWELNADLDEPDVELVERELVEGSFSEEEFEELEVPW